MTWHPDERLLQDHLEKLLPREDEERIRDHLEGCAACREELRDLEELLSELGSLPQEAQTSRDLWPQIAWRMGPEGSSAPSWSGTKTARRRFSLTGWQLMAASLTVAILSGGMVWAVLTRPSPSPSFPVVTPTTAAQPAGLPEALTEYDAAVADLEAVLEQGRELLDEETIRVVEENLRIIDDAIRDAQEALALDPASGILQRVLAGNLRRKLDLLRHAAVAVYAHS
jgi:hypothetical protein